MKVEFITSGSLVVENENLWCRDANRSRKPIELPAENGLWNIHYLRTPKAAGLFSERNIMVAFSFEQFPYDVKQCITDFYAGEDTIKDQSWGVIKETLMVDTGEAIFCSNHPEESKPLLFPNHDSELQVSWGENGVRMRTGFGDGKYDVYTFVKIEGEYMFPMLIIADFMVFADNVEVTT